MADDQSIASQEEPPVPRVLPADVPVLPTDMDRLSRPSSPAPPETGCLGGALCDPTRSYYRFVGLVFMCFLGFGSYFVYDTPAALQNQIKTDMNVNTYQFQSLYYLYSWPNVVLCFAGGFLIDRVFGIRLGAIIFSSIVTGGQFVYAFGALAGSFWMMQLGRFIFGLGGESLAVAVNTYAVSWFKGKELNFVFGLQLSMARVGSTVNFYVMEPVYEWVASLTGEPEGYQNLGYALIIAGTTCIFSLLCAIIIGLMDRRRSRILHQNSGQVGEKIQLRDIKSFPLTFWLISIICVFYYAAIFPFVSLSKVFFMYKYEFGAAAADSVAGIPYIISAFVSPVLGLMVDRLGRNITWVFLACIGGMVCHLMMAFTFVNPYVPMVLMGISYSVLASSLWPMVAIILPENQLGTGYGIMQSIQNLGLALMAMLSGAVVDSYGYLVLEVLNVLSIAVAASATAAIYIIDEVQNDGYLSMAASLRPIDPPSVVRLEEKARQRRLPASNAALDASKRASGVENLATDAVKVAEDSTDGPSEGMNASKPKTVENAVSRKISTDSVGSLPSKKKSFITRQLSGLSLFSRQTSNEDNVIDSVIVEEGENLADIIEETGKFKEIFGDSESVKEAKSATVSTRSSIFKDSGRLNEGFEEEVRGSIARSSKASRRSAVSKKSSGDKSDKVNEETRKGSVSSRESAKSVNQKAEIISLSSTKKDHEN